MKKYIWVAAMSMMFFACNNQKTETSQQSADATTAPLTESSTVSTETTGAKAAIQFEKEQHDFGDIVEGQKSEYIFKFTNTNETPLIITDAKASCGCTVPEYPKNTPFAKGQGGEIKVVFDSNGKGGQKFNKTVTVTANIEGGSKTLTISGNVLKSDGPTKN